MQVNSNEIYPYLLEKAYSKINNNYFKGVVNFILKNKQIKKIFNFNNFIF